MLVGQSFAQEKTAPVYLRNQGSGKGSAVSSYRAPSAEELSERAKLPEKTDNTNITLNIAIDRAIKSNIDIRTKRLDLRSAELAYRTAFDTMFIPQFKMDFDSNQTFTSGALPKALTPTISDEVRGARKHGYPESSLKFVLGEYTLFNFFKDWNSYEQARLTWMRTQQQYNESLRALRFDITAAYFKAKTAVEQLETSKRSADIAAAIYELVKSKVQLGQAEASESESSQVDLMSARNEVNSQTKNAKEAMLNLNQLLGDTIGTVYVLLDSIKYAPLMVGPDQAMKHYLEHAPNILNARKEMRVAELNLENTEKARLPLPTVKFSGVTLEFGNNYWDTTRDLNTGSTGEVAMNLSASVSLSLPLYGPDGFMSSRKVELAYLNREKTELSLQNTLNTDSVSIYQSLVSIKNDESTIENQKTAFESSAKLLDALFSKLSDGSVSRLELRDAIKNARDSEIALMEAKVTHLENKLNFAKLIGLDHLPGDPY